MRKKILSLSLLIVLLFQSSFAPVTALAEPTGSAVGAARRKESAPAHSRPSIDLKTATEKSIVFKTVEADVEVNLQSPDHEIPHLVLYRNGVLTPGFERTLYLSVENVEVPASGLFVQLIIETQHGDPDLERKRDVRLVVWKETRFVSPDTLAEEREDMEFTVRFDPLTELPGRSIQTPTDYYRYKIHISDAQGNRIESYAQDYAFLMENQWRVPLPPVLEADPGAAPDELVVYYYDMVPFQRDLRDPLTRIPREGISRYIQTELIPAMVEAYQVQSNLWGFPWYAEWRNFRLEEDAKTLSVALGAYKTWFHGKPASLGHSMISIRVDGTAGEYDNLTDGLMSVFHHELFHNHQRNMSLHYAERAAIAGKDEAWMMFSEGTAVLASAVGQPEVQFEPGSQLRSYMKRAHAFIGAEGIVSGGLNRSYQDIPYHTALYWRFLYEQCGGLGRDGEDPARGMQVIRQILETLYQGKVVDINASVDTASGLALVIDETLRSTSSCPFRTHEESLVHFARAIYMLRLEGGSCPVATTAPGCGLLDPHHLYPVPPAEQQILSAESVTQVSGSIAASFGIDLVELAPDASQVAESLKLVFTSAAATEAAFHIEVWKTTAMDKDGEPRRQSAQVGELVSMSTNNGRVELEIEEMNTGPFDSLGLIIVRVDTQEAVESTAGYTVTLIPD